MTHIKKLPESAKVLCISGEKDEFIQKNVPVGKARGEALWKSIIEHMACETTLKMVPKAGHGTIPTAKGQKPDALNNIMKWIKDFTAAK